MSLKILIPKLMINPHNAFIRKEIIFKLRLGCGIFN